MGEILGDLGGGVGAGVGGGKGCHDEGELLLLGLRDGRMLLIRRNKIFLR